LTFVATVEPPPKEEEGDEREIIVLDTSIDNYYRFLFHREEKIYNAILLFIVVII